MHTFSKKIILYPLLLIALIFFGLLFYSNSFNSPFERDEGQYAYSAWLLKNDIMPYENSFMLKPPVTIYFYYIGLIINPNAVWPPRVIAFIFTILSAVLIGLIAKKEFGNLSGVVAMFLFIPMSAFPYLAPFAANTERFMLLPLVGTLAVYVYCRDKKSFHPFFWAGFLGILALLTKQLCLVPLVFLFGFWILEKSRLIAPLKKIAIIIVKKSLGLSSSSNKPFRTDTTQKLVKENLTITLKSALFILLGMSSGFFLIGGYFLIKVPHQYLWETWFTYNLAYATRFDIGNFAKYAGIFMENWWILLLLIPWFIARKIQRWKFYIILLLLSLASVMASEIGHYYLLAIPFWTIISAAAIGDIMTTLHGKEDTKDLLHSIKKTALPAIFLVFIFILIIFPIANQLGRSPEQMGIWIYGFGNPFVDAKVTAEKLREATGSEDKVFIAGSEPEILFYAKRFSSSRFDITYPLAIATPFREKYQRETVAELEKNPPAAIVFSNQTESGLWQNGAPKIFTDYLKNILQKDYILVGGFVQKNIGENQKGSWQEKIAESDASLLLYKRR